MIGYKQALPIVEVAAIIGSPASGPTLPTTTGAGISPDDTYTYLPEYQLGIDLSTFPSARFEMLGNDLQIIDTATEKTLSINPFVCVANDPLKDCTVLKNNVTDTESFTTAAGATFSRFPESEKWFATHEKR